MDRGAVDGVRGFHDPFGDRGVRVNQMARVRSRGFQSNQGGSLCDQFRHVRPDHVDTQDLLILPVADELDEPFILAQNRGFANSGKRKLARYDVVSPVSRLILRKTDARDFRAAVRAVGHEIVVNRLGALAGDVPHGEHALVRGEVRQLLCGHHIADCKNTRDVGFHSLVHRYESLRLSHSQLLQPNPFANRTPPDGNQSFLGYDCFDFAPRESHCGVCPAVLDLMIVQTRVRKQLHSLLAKDLLELFGNLMVLHRQDSGQHLNNCHIGSHSGEDRCELNAHGACADDHQRPGDPVQIEDLLIGQQALPVQCYSGKQLGLRPGGHDDVPGPNFLDRFPLDLDHAGTSDRSLAAKGDDLVFFHQEVGSHSQLLDDFVLPRLHEAKVQVDVFVKNAELFTVEGLFVEVGVEEEGVCGYADPMKTGAAKLGVFLNQGDVQAELSGLDGCDVASRARPDHGHVVKNGLCTQSSPSLDQMSRSYNFGEESRGVKQKANSITAQRIESTTGVIIIIGIDGKGRGVEDTKIHHDHACVSLRVFASLW